MQPIQWSKELEIGIDVIDGQHRRIVDYINELQQVTGDTDRPVVRRVIDDLIDYTYSHFAFEEALMEEADYDSLPIHRKTHEAFCSRIEDFKRRAQSGEAVEGPLAELLRTWLLRHIMSDDTSYAELVRRKMPRIRRQDQGSWLDKTMRRFFANT
jgi:hemerythrin